MFGRIRPPSEPPVSNGLPQRVRLRRTRIGGGIVPKLGDYFDRSMFRERFEDKGRYRAYLAGVPTDIIIARNPALRGLATLLLYSQ